MRFAAAILFPLAVVLSACPLLYGKTGVTLSVEGDTMTMVGVIDGKTPAQIEKALADTPGLRTLVLQKVLGSADDVANLKASRMIRNAGLTTIVPSDGIVASGSTDMFLAGLQRQVAPGACLGVHSWGGRGVFAGSDLPRDDPMHQMYLDYYDEMDIDAEFYWYTLAMADTQSIHWMTHDEMLTYGVSTTRIDTSVPVDQQVCNRRAADPQ